MTTNYTVCDSSLYILLTASKQTVTCILIVEDNTFVTASTKVSALLSS